MEKPDLRIVQMERQIAQLLHTQKKLISKIELLERDSKRSKNDIAHITYAVSKLN